MSNPKPTLAVVDFPGRGFLYPRSPEDHNLLIERGVPICAIPRDLFPSLKEGLLKGVKTNVVNGRPLVKEIFEAFQQNLSEAVRFKTIDEGELRMKFAIDDLEFIQASVRRLTVYLGRFGFSVKFEISRRGEVVVAQLNWKASPDINPALFFDDTGTAESREVQLNMTAVARLLFKKQPSVVVTGQHAVSVEFQDKMGETYVPVTSRCFDVSQLSRSELYASAMFLMQIAGKAGKP